MKKYIMALALMISSTFMVNAQGLEGLIVEKFYVTDAADAAGSVGTLPTGSVVWRFYADLAPGWEFQAAYGNTDHTLTFTTTTAFFNNEDRGASTANAVNNNFVDDNTVLIDSWVSVGAASSTRMGVLKSEDDGINNTVNSDGLLLNNDPSAAPALTVQDGFFSGAMTPEPVTVVGLTTELGNVFDAVSLSGSALTTNNGSWASLNGSQGATASNTVLIAQVTTDGELTYSLNIQVRNTTTNAVENYVHSNPVGSEILMTDLAGVLNQSNALPTCAITSPVNGATFLVGDNVNIDATAADSDGTITQVEFFVDGVSIGIDNTAPYSAPVPWVATAGAHVLTAVATDNLGGTTTSAPVNITVGNVIPPTVSITSPTNGTFVVDGDNLTIEATAADADGVVTQVEFFVDGVSVGVDATAPYSVIWPASGVGLHTLTAIATDDDGATTTSSTVTIQVISSAVSYTLETSTNNCASSIFCLPLTAIVPVTDVIGYDVILSYDNSKVSPTGAITVASDLVTPTWTSVASSVDAVNGLMYISVFFNQSAPSTASFNGTGELFCVEFVKTPGFSSPDTAVFAVNSLQESYFNGVLPGLVADGSYITINGTSFSSNLVYWANNGPLRGDGGTLYNITDIFGDVLACTQATSTLAGPSVNPDINGNFVYDAANGPAINIVRDIDPLTDVQDVINGFDQFLIRRILINDASYIPTVYEMISADVNLDGVVSAGDLSQVSQRAVLAIDEFKQSWNYDAQGNKIGDDSKDWGFVSLSTVNNNPDYSISANYPFAAASGYWKGNVPVLSFCQELPTVTSGNCTIFDQDVYIGLNYGDVNGNWATAGVEDVVRTASSDRVVFDLESAVNNNGTIEIPVFINSSLNVNSLDFGLDINAEVLSVEDMTGTLEMESHMNSADSKYRFTSYSLENIDITKQVVKVKLSAAKEMITTSDIISAIAYVNGEEVSVSFKKGLNSLSEDLQVNIFPNPANEQLNLLVSENASVEMFDATGRLVYFNELLLANEKLEISSNLFEQGVYNLRIFNSEFSTIRKVVINH